MKRTSNYLTLFTLILSFVASLLASNTVARSEPVGLLGGFKIVKLSSELSGQWEVEGSTGAEVGFFVWDDTVTSAHQYKPDGLDEFARIVTELRVARYQMESNIQFVTFAAGATQISYFDVKFAELGEHKVKVQLLREHAGVPPAVQRGSNT